MTLKRTLAIVLITVLVMSALAFTAYAASKANFDWIVTQRLTVTNEIVGRAMQVRIQDAAAASTTNVISTSFVAGETSITSSSLTQMDYARNLVLAVTATTTPTAGTITIVGTGANGESTYEGLAFSAISGTQTITGSMPWANVSSIAIPVQSITLTVKAGGGLKFGMPFKPRASAAYKVTLNNTNITTYTLDTTYGTVALSALSANDDLTVWLKQ